MKNHVRGRHPQPNTYRCIVSLARGGEFRRRGSFLCQAYSYTQVRHLFTSEREYILKHLYAILTKSTHRVPLSIYLSFSPRFPSVYCGIRIAFHGTRFVCACFCSQSSSARLEQKVYLHTIPFVSDYEAPGENLSNIRVSPILYSSHVDHSCLK